MNRRHPVHRHRSRGPASGPYLLVLLLVLLPVLLLGWLPPAGAENSVRPGINRHYQEPDWHRWVNVFESPQREVYARRFAILAATGVQPGMEVADIGAGTGLFTRLFADIVGASGTVYAIDIAQNFIDNIMRVSRELGQDNVVGIVNRDTETGLAPGSIDLAFITDTYHHFEYPESMLESIHGALRPGGRMIIIDFVKDPHVSSDWVMGHVRADKQKVINEISRAGFEFTGEKPVLKYNYFLEFRRK